MNRTAPALSFKAIGILLSYPGPLVGELAPAAAEAMAGENLVPARLMAQVAAFADELATADRLDLEGRHHALFDRSRSLSLNLFEHVHGESRDRGQAMVELLQLYGSHGFDLASRELPDHLPLFLEFLSSQPFAEAQALLGEAAHVIAALAERLRKRRSPYQWPMLALAELAGETDAKALADLLAEAEDDPDDLEALDRIWADDRVSFGPDDAGCATKNNAAARVEPMQRGA